MSDVAQRFKDLYMPAIYEHPWRERGIQLDMGVFENEIRVSAIRLSDKQTGEVAFPVDGWLDLEAKTRHALWLSKVNQAVGQIMPSD